MKKWSILKNILIGLPWGLRVLYTIIEWLLKSAWRDNCAAVLNKFSDF